MGKALLPVILATLLLASSAQACLSRSDSTPSPPPPPPQQPASQRYTGPTNQAGLELIKEFEDFYPDFYNDSAEIMTIGYGHACHVWDCTVPLNGKYNVPLSESDAEALLLEDLSTPGRYEGCVNDAVKTETLTANQYSAMVSFTFNMGCGNFRSSTMLEALNKNFSDLIQVAANNFHDWNKVKGDPTWGLARRREAEQRLFCDGANCKPTGFCNATVTFDGAPIYSAPGGTYVGTLRKGKDTVIFGMKKVGVITWYKIYWWTWIQHLHIQITNNNGAAYCKQVAAEECRGRMRESQESRSGPGWSNGVRNTYSEGQYVKIVGGRTGGIFWFELDSGSYVPAYTVEITKKSLDSWCRNYRVGK